jgi:hypothetical protein
MLWIPIALVLLLVVFRLYGWSGVVSASLFAGALLVKDAAAHFWGKLGEGLVVGAYVVLAIAIYVLRRLRRNALQSSGNEELKRGEEE